MIIPTSSRSATSFTTVQRTAGLTRLAARTPLHGSCRRWRASSPNIESNTSAKISSAWRWRMSCRLASPNMASEDHPRAPYKVYEGDELKGTYATRAEARRAQQRLESQAAGLAPQRNFIIRDN